jgi:hypothetical protein
LARRASWMLLKLPFSEISQFLKSSETSEVSEVSGTWNLAPGPGTWHLEPGTWHLARPAFWKILNKIKTQSKQREMEDITQNYREHIEKILKKPNVKDPSTYLEWEWSGNPSEIEEKLILFLAEKHSDGEEVGMFTRSSRYIKIKLNESTGSIFSLERSQTPVLAIYVGESKSESGAKISYFYVSGDCGLSFWTQINSSNLKDQKKLEIELLRTVLHLQKVQKVIFKKMDEDVPSHLGDLYKNLGMFHDGKIICTDGDVCVNRMVLCMRSKFFFVYFTKYTIEHFTIKMDVPKIVIEKYIEFLFLHQISGDVLMDSSLSGELLDFGNRIGDISFIQWIYHKLWDMIDDEQEKMNLNQLMEVYQIVLVLFLC